MPIDFSEIEPVLELTQDETRKLAKALHLLWAGTGFAQHISLHDCKRAIQDFDKGKLNDRLNAGTDSGINGLIVQLKHHEWLRSPPDKNDLSLALEPKVRATAAAMHGQRMTFAEACIQSINLKERLDLAPQIKDGISVNHVLLYGSSVRDKNKKGYTIGDLDLAVNMGFDERYRAEPPTERNGLAWNAWKEIITDGNERLTFFIGVEPSWSLLNPDDNVKDDDGNPHCLIQLWANKNPTTSLSSLLPAQIAAIPIIEKRTLQTQERARIIHKLIHNDSAPVTRPEAIRHGDVTISRMCLANS